MSSLASLQAAQHCFRPHRPYTSFFCYRPIYSGVHLHQSRYNKFFVSSRARATVVRLCFLFSKCEREKSCRYSNSIGFSPFFYIRCTLRAGGRAFDLLLLATTSAVDFRSNAALIRRLLIWWCFRLALALLQWRIKRVITSLFFLFFIFNS